MFGFLASSAASRRRQGQINFSVTLTGLTGGEARQGDTIGVSISPEPDPALIEGYQWTEDGAGIAGATTASETVAIGTDHTDNGSLLCVVTIDGREYTSNAAPMRYAPGTFGALSDQIFIKDTGVQTYTFDAATGANLTWTYSLVGSQAGITLDSITRTISVDTDALDVQTDAIVQVAAADQYGRPAAGSPRTMLSSIWNAPTTVVADGTDTYIGPYTIGEVLTRHGEWEANIGQVSLEHVHLDWYSGGHTGALQDFNVASPDLGDVSLTSLIQTLYDRGTLTVVSWYPLAIDSTDLGWFDGTNTIPPIIEEILDGTHDAYLRTCAQQIAALDVPVMMGLFGEVDSIAVLLYGPNGTTAAGVPPADFTGEFGDPTILDGPERVAAAYRHVIGIFKEERADKVSWMIYTSSEFDPAGSPPEWFYPGDAYIDWIGQSLYLTDPADTADSVLKAGYDAWVSAAPGKPFIIPEFGIDGNAAPMNRDTAYTTVLTELANNTEFPELAAITVANASNFVANFGLPLITAAEYTAISGVDGYELASVTTSPATTWPVPPATNITPPVMQATSTAVGGVVTMTDGTWVGTTGGSFEEEIFRDGVSVATGNPASYTITDTDSDAVFTGVRRYTNSGGTTEATATGPITADTFALVQTTPPTVLGLGQEGTDLTSDEAGDYTWGGAAATVTAREYRLSVAGAVVVGPQSSPIVTIPAGTAGNAYSFEVRVTISEGGGQTSGWIEIASGTVAVASVPFSLNVVDGEHELDGASGLVTSTYTAPSTYANLDVGNGPGIFIWNADELADGPVNVAPPQISHDGMPTEGEQITVIPGIWAYDADDNVSEPTTSLLRLRDGAAAGSITSPYTLLSADVGTFAVRETATGANGSRSANSASITVAEASGAAINSITGSVGTIDVDHTGTLTVTGGVGTIDLEVA